MGKHQENDSQHRQGKVPLPSECLALTASDDICLDADGNHHGQAKNEVHKADRLLALQVLV